jgi:hypothetical protein
MADAGTKIADWWRTGVPVSLKLVFLVLLANGLPAFVILLAMPGNTDDAFVWTVKPDASARLLGVMYGNALLLVVIGVLQPGWARARVTLVLIAFFSVAATIVTLFNLDPFLDHPWYHLAYWLSMYAILLVAAPLVLFREERRQGGRLPVTAPLPAATRLLGAICTAVLGTIGVALLVDPSFVSDGFPWILTPLVGRIVGVWLSALAAAYAWALWDGDWLRGRPIFLQGIATGPALALLPLLHRDDLRDGAAAELTAYLGVAGLLLVTGIVGALEARGGGPDA